MDFSRYNESYVYSYVNKNNGMTYFGARWAYSSNHDKTASEDFDISYRSSSKSELFRRDMESGLLVGTILKVFSKDDLPVIVDYNGSDLTIDNVVVLALYYEDKLISEFWSTHGKSLSYNKVRNFRKDGGFYIPDNMSEYYNSDKCKLVAANNMRIMQSKSSNPESRRKANNTNKSNHGGVLGMHLPDSRSKQRESDKVNHGGTRAWNLPESIEKRSATFMERHDPSSWLNSESARIKRDATDIEKYGCKNHTNLLNTEEAKRKSHEYYLYITSDSKLRFMTRNSATHFHPDWIKLCKKSECDEFINELESLKLVISIDDIKLYIDNLLSATDHSSD